MRHESVTRRAIYQEETRRKILVAARRVFSRFGYANATLEKIAAAARMGKSSLYYYFPGKKDVFIAMTGTISSEMLDRIRQALAAETSAEGKLYAFFRARLYALNSMARTFRRFRDDERTFHSLTQGARQRHQNAELPVLRAILALGVEQGEFAIRDLDATTELIDDIAHNLQYPWTIGNDLAKVEGLTARVLELVLHGFVRTQEKKR